MSLMWTLKPAILAWVRAPSGLKDPDAWAKYGRVVAWATDEINQGWWL